MIGAATVDWLRLSDVLSFAFVWLLLVNLAQHAVEPRTLAAARTAEARAEAVASAASAEIDAGRLAREKRAGLRFTSPAAPTDQVLAEVGSAPIRVSDARAQGVLANFEGAEMMSPAALYRTGLVEAAADEVALATAAVEAGFADDPKVQAQLALAHRRILSSAYLDNAVQRTVTREAVAQEYAARRAAASARQHVTYRHILVSSEDEARDLRARLLDGARFPELAARRSVEVTSRMRGGLVGTYQLGELPPEIAPALAELPVGAISDPVKTLAGWHIFTVDARTMERFPPYELVAHQIEQELSSAVVGRTVAAAKAVTPVRYAQGLESDVPTSFGVRLADRLPTPASASEQEALPVVLPVNAAASTVSIAW